MTVPFNWRGDFRAALAGWIEARIYVAAAYVTTLAIVDRQEPSPAFSPVDDGLIPWDGTWYRDLAGQGYDSPGLEGGSVSFRCGHCWVESWEPLETDPTSLW